MSLLARRRPDATICPSEVARALAPSDAWRALMPAVVEVARTLARDGEVEITQRGVARPPDEAFVGPIRIRLAQRS